MDVLTSEALTENEVRQILTRVEDPELPINIIDLGIVEKVELSPAGRVIVKMIPTFVGCASLEIIRRRAVEQLHAHGLPDVRVVWNLAAKWHPNMISQQGRANLAEYGVVPAQLGQPSGTVDGSTTCPYCGSSQVETQATYGSALCRVGYFCQSCRNSFEGLKCPGSHSNQLAYLKRGRY
jgi:ring-1,2-phenylacetyl-CoA epoxidase subunit PaaD